MEEISGLWEIANRVGVHHGKPPNKTNGAMTSRCIYIQAKASICYSSSSLLVFASSFGVPEPGSSRQEETTLTQLGGRRSFTDVRPCHPAILQSAFEQVYKLLTHGYPEISHQCWKTGYYVDQEQGYVSTAILRVRDCLKRDPRLR